MTGVAPSLSVIVTASAPAGNVRACLRSLVEQCGDGRVEIIVAYASDGEPLGPMPAGAGDITAIRLPAAASLPRLLGAAIVHAHGDVIAITDAACAVDRHWVSGILEAHAAPHPVIGGAVEPEGLRTLADWAAYFCDYAQFMLPLREGVVGEVPGNNISMKRWALAGGRAFVAGEFWKAYWCRRLQADGVSLHATPSMVVFYRKSFRLGQYLAHRFHNGRCFAGMRRSRRHRAARAMYLAGSPMLPVLFCLRLLRRVLPKRRHLGRLVLAFPVILLAILSWSCGEFCGYLWGPGASCRHVR